MTTTYYSTRRETKLLSQVKKKKLEQKKQKQNIGSFRQTFFMSGLGNNMLESNATKLALIMIRERERETHVTLA